MTATNVFGIHRGLRQTPGRRLLVVALATLSVAAWVSLWLWGHSADARFLHHESTASAAAGPTEAALFVAGWAVMIVAMMLPTSLPLVATFGALVARRRQPALLVGLVVVAYVGLWTAFGLVLYFGDRLVHVTVDAMPWLAAHPALITAATLAVAGAYQFSPLKYRCLDECRSPLGFVVSRWQGRHERRDAFGIGLAHGLFCLGCCWSIMLVMFAVGLGSLAWMLVLGVVMAVEKNVGWGRRLGRPLGVVLILAAVAVVSG
jgi:predicted metal-binding membrane protein